MRVRVCVRWHGKKASRQVSRNYLRLCLLLEVPDQLLSVKYGIGSLFLPVLQECLAPPPSLSFLLLGKVDSGWVRKWRQVSSVFTSSLRLELLEAAGRYH